MFKPLGACLAIKPDDSTYICDGNTNDIANFTGIVLSKVNFNLLKFSNL